MSQNRQHMAVRNLFKEDRPWHYQRLLVMFLPNNGAIIVTINQPPKHQVEVVAYHELIPAPGPGQIDIKSIETKPVEVEGQEARATFKTAVVNGLEQIQSDSNTEMVDEPSSFDDDDDYDGYYISRQVPGGGLLNNGNQCHLNAVLQCICRMPDLVDAICIQIAPEKEELGLQLRSLSRQLIADERSIDNGGFVNSARRSDPNHLGALLNGHQHDAHETLHFLLGAVLRSNQLNSSVVENNPLAREMAIQIQWRRMNKSSPAEEFFWALPLPLTEEKEQHLNAISIMSLLTEPERGQGYFTHLPNVLCLQLLRFNQDGGENNARLSCPDFMLLNEENRQVKYLLKGFISHEGTSSSSGHYTACWRADDGWSTYDDHEVEHSQQKPNCTKAYIVFYERDDDFMR
jgi:hypothetical protein